MAKRRLSAAEVTNRLVAGAQANVGRYVDGIKNTEGNPLEKAIAKKNKAKIGFAEAIDSGRWENGLKNSSKEEWMAGAIAGGGSAYTAGIQAKRNKIERKLGPALEATYNVADSVANMPTDTIAQRIAKSTAYQQKRYDASRNK